LERGLRELIQKAWTLVDFALERLENSESETQQAKWASVLSTAINTLSKLMDTAGVGKLEKDDLASLLSKIPKRIRKMVMQKIERAMDFE